MRLLAGTAWDQHPTCERCEKPLENCECEPLAEPPPRIPPEKQRARLAVERRKKGKQVTTVRGLSVMDLPELLTDLKSLCGAGGSIQDDVLEIQGSHVDRIAQFLQRKGYRT
ncbi:MAG: translation initiation factor [Planctomycetales bacterium]|nr:translation initiation factor [Planctomycetales bacterium]